MKGKDGLTPELKAVALYLGIDEGPWGKYSPDDPCKAIGA